MMRINLMLFLILGLFVSCSFKRNEIKSELEDIMGSSLILNETELNKIPNNKYLLFVYLAGEECVPCTIEKYAIFKQYINDLESFNTKIIFVIEKNENEFIEDFFKELLVYEYILIVDDGHFKKMNTKIISNPFCKSFVVDDKFKIIWVGSPIEDKDSYSRFKKMMLLLNEK